MRQPFPILSIPNQTITSHIYDPYGIVDDTLRYIENIIRDESSVSGIIVGNYGFGKTHFLLYIKNYIETKYNNAFTVYVSAPGQGIKDIYKAIINKIISKYIDEIIEYIDKPLDNILKVIKENTEDTTYLKQWILGESIPTKYRQKYGLGSNINEDRETQIITKVLKALYRAKHVPIAIFIDEIEDIIAYNTKKKIRYLNYLRILIDNLPPQTILLVASTPAGWTEIINTHPALSRRLTSLIVYLKPLEHKYVKEFLEFYMKINNSFVNWIINDKIIDLIYEYSDGNPGEILRLAAILYMHVSTRHLKKLDTDLSKEVLSKYV